jgi:glucose/mannose-6-phosphate isomerase
MLDDLKYIHSRDASDALGTAEKAGQQLRYECSFDVQPTDAIKNIVLVGMGSSAAAGAIIRQWLPLTVPYEIIENYDLPSYVDDTTLLVLVSQSGNTIEVIQAATAAAALPAHPGIIVLTSGGALKAIAAAQGYPCLILPLIAQPRFAILYHLKALTTVLVSLGLATVSDLDALNSAAELVDTASQDWLPTVSTKHNKAKQIALDVIGKSVVISGGPRLAVVADNWKAGFNETAQQLAWSTQYPAANHSELVSWTAQPINKPYAIIELHSRLDRAEVTASFELGERLLSGRRPAPIVVQAYGETMIEQLLWTQLLGTFVTIYTALANGLDPTPIDLITELKTRLASRS